MHIFIIVNLIVKKACKVEIRQNGNIMKTIDMETVRNRKKKVKGL